MASTQAVSRGGGSTPLSGMVSGAFCSSLRECSAVRGRGAGRAGPPRAPAQALPREHPGSTGTRAHSLERSPAKRRCMRAAMRRGEQGAVSRSPASRQDVYAPCACRERPGRRREPHDRATENLACFVIYRPAWLQQRRPCPHTEAGTLLSAHTGTVSGVRSTGRPCPGQTQGDTPRPVPGVCSHQGPCLLWPSPGCHLVASESLR